MATPPNDDTIMLFKLLADGQWHPYEEIRDRLAATVPPGRALRKYQERVDYARRYKGDPDYDTEADEDTRIYYGARACAQIAITSWKGRGVMYMGEGPNKKIRIKPGFKSWGIEQVTEENRDIVPPRRAEAAPEGQGVTETPPEEPAPAGEAAAAHGDPTGDHLANYQWLCPRCSYMNSGLACTHCGVLLMDSSMGGEQQKVASDELAEQESPEDAVVEVVGPVEPKELPTAVPEDDEVPDYAAGDPDRDGYAWPPLTDGYGECEVCGELIKNAEKHAEWHRHLEERMAVRDREEMALFAESEIRELVGEVIADHLDRFQVNMVDYLSTQFAQLETMIWRQSRGQSNRKFPR